MKNIKQFLCYRVWYNKLNTSYVLVITLKYRGDRTCMSMKHWCICEWWCFEFVVYNNAALLLQTTTLVYSVRGWHFNILLSYVAYRKHGRRQQTRRLHKSLLMWSQLAVYRCALDAHCEAILPRSMLCIGARILGTSLLCENCEFKKL